MTIDWNFAMISWRSETATTPLSARRDRSGVGYALLSITITVDG